MKKNNVTTAEDVKGILECPTISVLDLSDNHIEDEKVLSVLEGLPNLKVLYLKGNPFAKTMQNYRRLIINQFPLLKYLDDRPVFPEERKLAEAWFVLVLSHCVYVFSTAV